MGNSTMQIDMARDGYRHIENTDISSGAAAALGGSLAHVAFAIRHISSAASFPPSRLQWWSTT